MARKKVDCFTSLHCSALFPASFSFVHNESARLKEYFHGCLFRKGGRVDHCRSDVCNHALSAGSYQSSRVRKGSEWRGASRRALRHPRGNQYKRNTSSIERGWGGLSALDLRHPENPHGWPRLMVIKRTGKTAETVTKYAGGAAAFMINNLMNGPCEIGLPRVSEIPASGVLHALREKKVEFCECKTLVTFYHI